MRTFRPLLVCAVCALVASGCVFNGKTDNGELELRNRTEAVILVSYDAEVFVPRPCSCDCDDDCGDIEIQRREAWVEPGERVFLMVDTQYWNGEIWVYYDGRLRIYDLDFNIWGRSELEVRAGDFPPEEGPAGSQPTDLTAPLADG